MKRYFVKITQHTENTIRFVFDRAGYNAAQTDAHEHVVTGRTGAVGGGATG